MATPAERTIEILSEFGIGREVIEASVEALGDRNEAPPTPTARVLDEVETLEGGDPGVRLVAFGHAMIWQDRTPHALTVFERAAKVATGEARGLANLRIGEVMIQRKNSARASAALRAAHAEPGPAGALAGIYLADLHEAARNRDAARKVLEEVLASGVAEIAPVASFRLGMLHSATGDEEAAEAAYRAAVEADHSDATPRASVNLGAMLLRRKQGDEAIGLLQSALNSNHPEAAPSAAAILAGILAGGGQREQAMSLYQFAAQRGGKDVSAAAAVRLGTLLADEGRVRDAKEVLEAAVNMKHETWSPRAQQALDLVEQESAGRRRGALRSRQGKPGPRKQRGR